MALGSNVTANSNLSFYNNPLYGLAQNIINAWGGGGNAGASAMGAQNPFAGGGLDSFMPSFGAGLSGGSDLFGATGGSGGGGGEGSYMHPGGSLDGLGSPYDHIPVGGSAPIGGNAGLYGTIHNLGGGVFGVDPGRSIPYGSRESNQPPGWEQNKGVYSAEYASTHTNSSGQVVDTASTAPLIEQNVSGDFAGVHSNYWTDRLFNYSQVHPEMKDFIVDFVKTNNDGENFAPGILPIDDDEFNAYLQKYGNDKGIDQESLEAFSKDFSKFEPDGATNNTIEGINENGEITNIRTVTSESSGKPLSSSSKGAKGASAGDKKTDSDSAPKKTSGEGKSTSTPKKESSGTKK